MQKNANECYQEKMHYFQHSTFLHLHIFSSSFSNEWAEDKIAQHRNWTTQFFSSFFLFFFCLLSF